LINPNLHRQPVALDSVQHRNLKLAAPITDWRMADRLNALFVAAVEFGDVCREFPIVFVRAGKEDDGIDAIAPIAVLGLTQNENLYVSGERWRAQYMPALLRMYPFCIARIDAEKFAICLDMAWSGVNTPEGHPLFDDEGKPAELLKSMQQQLEVLEGEIQRTRMVGRRLNELGLLQDMRFDVTLPDGRQHTVDGFLTIDAKKATELPDSVVCELHRNGMLGLMHMHWVSMGNMRRLVDWHVERGAASAPAVAANAPAA
jgi:SapC